MECFALSRGRATCANLCMLTSVSMEALSSDEIELLYLARVTSRGLTYIDVGFVPGFLLLRYWNAGR